LIRNPNILSAEARRGNAEGNGDFIARIAVTPESPSAILRASSARLRAQRVFTGTDPKILGAGVSPLRPPPKQAPPLEAAGKERNGLL